MELLHPGSRTLEHEIIYNSHLITRIYFARLIIPLGAVVMPGCCARATLHQITKCFMVIFQSPCTGWKGRWSELPAAEHLTGLC